MSNMIRMRNVGAKPRKSGGPEGLRSKGGGRMVEPGGVGARRVGGPDWWGPDIQKVRAPRVGVRRVGARRVGHRSMGARRVGA